MPPTNEALRIFLVDSHDIVRRGIASILEPEDDMDVVGAADSFATAMPSITDLRPDVVVLDAELPDRSGIELCREVRATDPDVKCLVLTRSDDAEQISAAILAGASGYVLKRIEGASLVSGIRLVASGHSLIDPAVAARVVEQMRLQQKSIDLICDLTPQQRRIFFLIAEGLTNRQIAARMFLAEKTIKNHVTGLLSRLGLEHRTQAALLAARLQDAAPGKDAVAV
jgi:DNA-binding NarL/FixJ family response regulator